MLSVASAKKLRVSELRAELQSRGLSADGVKAVLLKRLLSVLEDSTATSNDARKAADTAAASGPVPSTAAPVIPIAPTPPATDTAVTTKGEEKQADPPQQQQQPTKNDQNVLRHTCTENIVNSQHHIIQSFHCNN